MLSSQNGASQRSFALIAEVRDHLARLQSESPADAKDFRHRLMELLYEQDVTSTAQGRYSQELRKTRLHALRCREEERAHLAERLRAGPGQLLANAVAELAACLPLLETDPEFVRRGLQSLAEELRDGLDELRWILSELEPPQLMRELGLMDSLQLYAERLGRQNGIAVETRFPEQVPRFPPTMEVGIYRIVQEALRNAVRHGQASSLLVAIERQDDTWRFIVQDDGEGFDPEQLSYARGLVNMYEWARAFGSALEVQSKPGEGTRVILSIDPSALQIDRVV